MRRGEVWWANIPMPSGRRPVLLLSRDRAYAVRSLITVAPLTTRFRGIASETKLGRADGLPRTCVVNLDSIMTIPKDFLDERLASLGRDKIGEVDEAIRFALQLSR